MLVESVRPWQQSLAAELDALWRAGKPQGEMLIPLTEFKVHAAEVANTVTRRALDVSGGYGYKRGPLERAFRDARAAIAMGPVEQHRPRVDRQDPRGLAARAVRSRW